MPLPEKSNNSFVLPLAKFNCTVPGTIRDFFDECNKTMTTDLLTTESTVFETTIATTTFNASKDGGDKRTDSETGSIFYIILTVLGVCIATVTVTIVIAITTIGVKLAKRKRQSYTVTTALAQDNSSRDAVQHLEEHQQWNSHGR